MNTVNVKLVGVSTESKQVKVRAAWELDEAEVMAWLAEAGASIVEEFGHSPIIFTTTIE